MFALAQNATNNAGDRLGELGGDNTLTEAERAMLQANYEIYLEHAARLHVLSASFNN